MPIGTDWQPSVVERLHQQGLLSSQERQEILNDLQHTRRLPTAANSLTRCDDLTAAEAAEIAADIYPLDTPSCASVERRREKTRERVRKHRERKRQTA